MQHDHARPAVVAAPLRLLALAAAVAVVISGCASGAEREISPVIMRSFPSTVPAALDPGLELQAALEATGHAYRFETTVMVGDAVTEYVSGVVSGAAWYATIDVGGATTEYLKTDDGEWVRSIAELWIPADVVVDEPVLEVFGTVSPSGISSWDATEDGWIELHARYPGASVGAPEVDEVDVEVTIGDGVVREVRYVVPAGDDTVEVVTVISEVGDIAPIENPVPGEDGERVAGDVEVSEDRSPRPAR